MAHRELADPPARTGNLRRGLIPAALLVGHFFLAVSAASQKCATFDEPVHLTSGYTPWVFGDYRLQLGHITQRWAALPLLVSCPQFPSREQEYWTKSNTWQIAHQFLYLSGNDADFMLLQGRVMIALLDVALGGLIFVVAHKLFGWLGGLVSLVLWAFCPTMLAHGALVTTDMGATLLFAAALTANWWAMNELTPWSLLASCLAMAGLFLAKFSAALMLPMLAALLGLRVLDGRALPVHLIWCRSWTRRWQQLAGLLCVIVVQGVAVWASIWSFYGFRFTPYADGPLPQNEMFPGWAAVQAAASNTPAPVEIVLWARDRALLPEAYLFGFADTLINSSGRPGFLNGQINNQGWPWFFPYAFLVKTPLALFVILFLAVTAVAARWRSLAWRDIWAAGYAAAPWWVLLAVYGTASIRSHLNIGHRHILPMYAGLYILAGAAGWWWRKPGAGPTPGLMTSSCRLALALALAWWAMDGLAAWPNYLAYFNQIVGGPRNGYKHLVDSSLDWGQDVPGLKKWLQDQGLDGQANIYLSYFGNGDPYYYKIDAVRLPVKYATLPSMANLLYVPGFYCISATNLQGVPFVYHDPWDERLESLYRKGLDFQWHFNHRDEPASRAYLEEVGRENWLRKLNQSHALSFARLCSHLKRREPDGEIGFSILIYYVTEAELERALPGRKLLEPRH